MDGQGSWGGPNTEKQQFGQCLGNGEQASSTAEATARLGATSNCPESGLGWNLDVLPTIRCWAAELGLTPLVLWRHLAGDEGAPRGEVWVLGYC